MKRLVFVFTTLVLASLSAQAQDSLPARSDVQEATVSSARYVLDCPKVKQQLILEYSTTYGPDASQLKTLTLNGRDYLAKLPRGARALPAIEKPIAYCRTRGPLLKFVLAGASQTDIVIDFDSNNRTVSLKK